MAITAAAKKKIGSDMDRKRQWMHIQEMRAKGETMERIAETMNAVGEVTPRGLRWSAGSVHAALNKWNDYFLQKTI